MTDLKILANENPLPKEFDCTKCHNRCKAACCTMVPLPPELIKRNAHRFQQKVIEFIKIYDAVIPVTQNRKCPFLKADYSCAVYKWRPSICRLFGTEINENLTCRFMDKNGVQRKSTKFH